MDCAHCATPVPDNARYCHNCGSLVSDAEGQATATAAMDDSSVRHMERLLKEDTAGEFEILHPIGRGGMAVVYLANEVHLARRVAIKVLPPELTFGHGVERFKREARTAAALDHPNIIPIYRIASGGRIFWYAMKYLEGHSLDQHIKTKKRLDLDETLDILDHVADALDYAHRKEVVHRDIKPANVMLDPRGRVIVTDFGIAKPLTESTLTASGSLVGTPYYMSPEQGMGKPVGGASDQYSVAVMAYHMLTGQVPFEGDSAIEVLHKHCTTPPPPMDILRPGLPLHVYAAVKRALAKKADQRFPSVSDFVEGMRRPGGAADAAALAADTATRLLPQTPSPESKAIPTAPTARPATPDPSVPTPIRATPADSTPAHSIPTPPEPTHPSAATTPIDAVWTPPAPPAAAPRKPGPAPGLGRRRARSRTPIVVLGLLIIAIAGVLGARTFLDRRGPQPETLDIAQSAGGAEPEAGPAGGGGGGDTGPPADAQPERGIVVAADSGRDDTASAPAGQTTGPSRPDTAPTTPPTRPPPAVERPPPASIASVTILANATTMLEGESQTLGYQVRDTRGGMPRDVAVQWRSTDPAVAAVSSSGRLQARSPGRAYIVAAVERRRDSVLISVSDRLLRVAIAQRDTTLAPGASIQLAAQALGARGPLQDRRIGWTSSSPAVVSVDANGKATARSQGRVRIIARSEDKVDTVTLTVSAPAPPPAPVAARPVAPGRPPAGEQIAALVQGYVQLLRAKDIRRIDGLYPVTDRVDQRLHKTLLEFLSDSGRDVAVSGFGRLAPQIGDDTASARFTVTFSYRSPFGASRSRDATFIAEFTRAEGVWQLVSCRLDARTSL